MVTEGILEQCPKLAHRLRDSGCYCLDRRSSVLSGLEQIPIATGHVIVHYLVMGKYGCLRPEGQSPEERNTAEFTTNLQVYIHSRAFELPVLERRARDEIEYLGKRLGPVEALRVIRHEYTDQDRDDPWLVGYVKQQMRSLCESPERLKSPDLVDSIVGDVSVTKFILQNALEVLSSLVEAIETTMLTPSTPPGRRSPDWVPIPARETPDPILENTAGMEPAPEASSEPAPEATSEPTPEPVPTTQYFSLDQVFSVPRKSKKGKKIKRVLNDSSAAVLDYEFEATPLESSAPVPDAPGPEAPETEAAEVVYCDSTPPTKKKKKKKSSAIIWDPEPVHEEAYEPEAERSEAAIPLAEGGYKSKLEALGETSAEMHELEPTVLSQETHEVKEEIAFLEAWGTRKPKKGTKRSDRFIWDTSCGSRTEHILIGDGWKECRSCGDFLLQRASQLQQA